MNDYNSAKTPEAIGWRWVLPGLFLIVELCIGRNTDRTLRFGRNDNVVHYPVAGLDNRAAHLAFRHHTVKGRRPLFLVPENNAPGVRCVFVRGIRAGLTANIGRFLSSHTERAAHSGYDLFRYAAVSVCARIFLNGPLCPRPDEFRYVLKGPGGFLRPFERFSGVLQIRYDCGGKLCEAFAKAEFVYNLEARPPIFGGLCFRVVLPK